MSSGLKNLAQTRSAGIQPVVDTLDHILKAAVIYYNSEVGPRMFGRRIEERVPTDPRLLTSFRGRVGSLIEYAFGDILDGILADDDEGLVWSHAVIHQYPDFFVRIASTREILLRVDFKALHVESAEYSARFDYPKAHIDPYSDLLIYLAWRWKQQQVGETKVVFPFALEALCMPAIDVATERDLRVEMTGGHIGDDNLPYVPKKRRSSDDGEVGWSLDTNFGKIDRIIHATRRDEELTVNMRRYLEFSRRYIEARPATSASEPTPDEIEPS